MGEWENQRKRWKMKFKCRDFIDHVKRGSPSLNIILLSSRHDHPNPTTTHKLEADLTNFLQVNVPKQGSTSWISERDH